MRRLLAVVALFAVLVPCSAGEAGTATHPTLLSNCSTGYSGNGSWALCTAGTGQVAAMVHCSQGWTSRWKTSSTPAARGSYDFVYCAAGEWADGRSYQLR
jgi:hypothetical protein